MIMDHSHVALVSTAEQTTQVLVLALHDVFAGEGGGWHVVEGNTGTGLENSQVLEGLLSHFVQIFRRVLVFGGLDGEVQLAVGLVGVVEAVGFWDVAVELLSNCQAGFIGPQSSDVVDCISATSEQHQWHTVSHHFLHALSMPSDAEVQPAQDIVGDAVSAELQDDSTRHELGHYFIHHCLEQLLISVVVDSDL